MSRLLLVNISKLGRSNVAILSGLFRRGQRLQTAGSIPKVLIIIFRRIKRGIQAVIIQRQFAALPLFGGKQRIDDDNAYRHDNNNNHERFEDRSKVLLHIKTAANDIGIDELWLVCGRCSITERG